jgi:hypothetical protein
MQMSRIIYYSLAALHVSSDIFAHHQEHLNYITTSGITHVCRYQMVSCECWHKVPTLTEAVSWQKHWSVLEKQITDINE